MIIIIFPVENRVASRLVCVCVWAHVPGIIHIIRRIASQHDKTNIVSQPQQSHSIELCVI